MYRGTMKCTESKKSCGTTSPYDELNKTENETESSSYRNLILCCCCCCYHLRFAASRRITQQAEPCTDTSLPRLCNIHCMESVCMCYTRSTLKMRFQWHASRYVAAAIPMPFFRRFYHHHRRRLLHLLLVLSAYTFAGLIPFSCENVHSISIGDLILSWPIYTYASITSE